MTGGASIVIATAAAGVHVGVNLNDAEDCNRNARQLREESASKNIQSQSLRSRKDTLETQKRTLEAEIRALEDKATTLHESSGGLQDLTGVLRFSVEVTDKLMITIEVRFRCFTLTVKRQPVAWSHKV